MVTLIRVGLGSCRRDRVMLHNEPLSFETAWWLVYFCIIRSGTEPPIEQCQMVVLVADDLGFLGRGIPDLVTELCPPQDTA